METDHKIVHNHSETYNRLNEYCRSIDWSTMNGSGQLDISEMADIDLLKTHVERLLLGDPFENDKPFTVDRISVPDQTNLSAEHLKVRSNGYFSITAHDDISGGYYDVGFLATTSDNKYMYFFSGLIKPNSIHVKNAVFFRRDQIRGKNTHKKLKSLPLDL